MKNWKTSLIGVGVGIAGAIGSGGFGISEGKFDWKSLLFSAGISTLGLFAKDHNVTGGTIQQ